MRRMLAVAVVSAMLLCAGIAGRAAGLDQERADAVAELRALAAQSHSAAQRTDYLEGAVDRAEQDAVDRAAVLELRPAFVAELAALTAALGGAEGKVDTATHRASALSTQQTVLAEKTDPATVTAATATINALTAKVGSEVASWDAVQLAQYAGPDGPPWATSGPDGYARVRTALDRVGGAGVGLYESSSCAAWDRTGLREQQRVHQVPRRHRGVGRGAAELGDGARARAHLSVPRLGVHDLVVGVRLDVRVRSGVPGELHGRGPRVSGFGRLRRRPAGVGLRDLGRRGAVTASSRGQATGVVVSIAARSGRRIARQ